MPLFTTLVQQQEVCRGGSGVAGEAAATGGGVIVATTTCGRSVVIASLPDYLGVNPEVCLGVRDMARHDKGARALP